MEKLKMQTPNLVDKNVEQIAKIFPEVITEIKNEHGDIVKGIDFDILKQKLSNVLVEDENERYRLDWPGKKASLMKANTPINKTLRPVIEESVNFETTENLYIEGDNFEVLKILQESYLGKVKMIYIDPPYNTGKDFIYKDNFLMSNEDYNEVVGILDEVGNKLFKENLISNPRYHSDWLSMMFERLIVARDLLKEDGIIFISIDDNEVHNLRKICDEIFGEENFLGDIIRATGTTTGQDAKKIGSSYDHTLCYSKTDEFTINGIPLTGRDLDRFSYNDHDGRGEYALLQLRKTGNADRKEDRENMFYPVIGPDGKDVYTIGPSGYLSRWRVAKETYEMMVEEELIVWKMKNEIIDEENLNELEEESNNYKDNSDQDLSMYNQSTYKPYVKYYLRGRKKQVSNLWTDIEGNKMGSLQLKRLFIKKIFNNPKPIGFIKRLIMISCSQKNLILDFFAGSSPTAHTILEYNIENLTNHKFIMVQIPEKIYEDEEAYKNGYSTITEIGKERIRRAGKKIVSEYSRKYQIELEEINKKLDSKSLFENNELSEQKTRLELKIDYINNIDIGFRVYKTDSSNMKDVYYHPNSITQEELFPNNMKEDRSPEDLLTQVILDLGLELSLSIEKKEIFGNTIFFVQTNALVACFDENIDFRIVDEIAKINPFKVVFKDSGFISDKDRINVEERFKRLSPQTVVKVI